MKLLPLAALSAITLGLLTGCAGTQESTPQSPAPSSPAPSPTAVPFSPRPVLPALDLDGSHEPIVIDLTNQAMVIPGTAFWTTNVPILAGGDVLAGSSIITAKPSGAISYTHCEDWTAAWATEPSAPDAGAWARPLQLVTFDPACTDVASIHGHAIVVPRVVTEYKGEYGTVDQWLTEGREILIVGESPHPDPNKGPMTDTKIEWPDDRPVHLRSFDYKG